MHPTRAIITSHNVYIHEYMPTEHSRVKVCELELKRYEAVSGYLHSEMNFPFLLMNSIIQSNIFPLEIYIIDM